MSSAPELQFLPHGGDDAPFAVGCMDVMLPQCENGDPGPFFRLYFPRDQRRQSVPDAKVSVYKRDYIPWLPRKEYVEAWIEGHCSLKRPFVRKRLLARAKKWNIKARWQAKLASSMPGEKWPLVLVAPAKGLPRFAYSALACEWASHGTIVAVLEHGSGACCWTYRLLSTNRGAGANSQNNGANNENNGAVHLRELPIQAKPLTKPPCGSAESTRALAHSAVNLGASEIERVLDVLMAVDKGDKGVLGEMLLCHDYPSWAEWVGKMDVKNIMLVGHEMGGASVLTTVTNRYCSITKAMVLDSTMYILDQKQYATLKESPTRILFVNPERVYRNEVNYRHWLCRKDPDRKKMLTIRGCLSSHFSDQSYIPLGCFNNPGGPISRLPTALLHEILTELMYEFRSNGDKSDWLGASKVRLRGRYANHIAVPAPAAVERRLNLNFSP